MQNSWRNNRYICINNGDQNWTVQFYLGKTIYYSFIVDISALQDAAEAGDLSIVKLLADKGGWN